MQIIKTGASIPAKIDDGTVQFCSVLNLLAQLTQHVAFAAMSRNCVPTSRG
jgi:hypothetical protein